MHMYMCSEEKLLLLVETSQYRRRQPYTPSKLVQEFKNGCSLFCVSLSSNFLSPQVLFFSGQMTYIHIYTCLKCILRSFSFYYYCCYVLLLVSLYFQMIMKDSPKYEAFSTYFSAVNKLTYFFGPAYSGKKL